MRRIVPFTTLTLVGAIGGCMAVPQAVGQEVAHALMAAIILSAAVVIASFLYQAIRHHRLAAGMAGLARHGAIGGEPVEFVAGLASPVVAGLWRPRIYCADDLTTRLDPDEVEAVVLHERHHLLDRAPLRMVALAAVAPAMGRVAQGRAWLERERARIEIAADRYALGAGASRPAIAGALLKLSETPGLVGAPGFASAADLRIRALLLDEPTGLDVDRPLVQTVAAVGFLLAACVIAYLS